MTDEQIERRVEECTNNIDRRYMANELTTEDYEFAIKWLNNWADGQYAAQNISALS